MEHVAFTAGLPKVELHLHLEGTADPGRGGTPVVLRTRTDVRDLATACFRRAAARGVRHAEVLLAPQAHVARGVTLEDLVLGHHDAAVAAGRELGLSAGLVLLLAGDQPPAGAEAVLEAATGFRDQVVGVALDAGGCGEAPARFAPLLARARAAGFRLAVHGGLGGGFEALRGWLEDVGVDRLDTTADVTADVTADPRSLALVRERGTGLVRCPLVNAATTGDPGGALVADLLRRGVRVAVASGDPARSGGYLTENLLALTRDVELTYDELIQLQRNAIEISWASEEVREGFLAELDAYEALVAPDL